MSDNNKIAELKKMLSKGLDGKDINPEMLKMLAAMQAQKMHNMPRHKKFLVTFLQIFFKKMSEFVTSLDRFVNFVAKPTDADRNDVVQAARSPILFGIWVVFIFFGVGMTWAALAPLDSASHASGVVASSTSRKIINHRAGGTVKAIYVKQGDKVHEGQPIISLDDNQFKSEYAILLNHYRTLKANESRLIAERDGLDLIVFAPELLKDAEKPEVITILNSQKKLFETRRFGLIGIAKQLKKQIEQSKFRLSGLKQKSVSQKSNHKFWQERLNNMKKLVAEGYASQGEFAEIENRYNDAKAQELVNESDILSAEQDVMKYEIELMNKSNEFANKVTDELKQTQTHLAEIYEKYNIAKENLEKAVLVSPVDGTVIYIVTTTVGAAVQGVQPLAEISPDKDHLIVEAKISPKDIAYVKVGQKAKMNFLAYKSRTTPYFIGKLISLSPDIVVERQSNGGEGAYYAAKIETRRRMPKKKVTLQQINQVIRESEAQKLRS